VNAQWIKAGHHVRVYGGRLLERLAMGKLGDPFEDFVELIDADFTDLTDKVLVDGGHVGADAVVELANDVGEAVMEFLKAGDGANLLGFELRAEGSDVGADAGGVGLGDGDVFAIDADGFGVDGGSEFSVVGRGDAGDAGEFEISGAELIELLDDSVGGGAADAEVFGAKLLPGSAKLLVNFRFTYLFQALRLGSGAFGCDQGKRLLTADPETCIEPLLILFHIGGRSS